MTDRTEEFRRRMLEARPDLAVFRARPVWQRYLIRMVWRVQRPFGFEPWSPRRERDARFSKAFRDARGSVPPDLDLGGD